MDKKVFKYIGAGLLTGTLDIAAAFTLYYYRTHKNPLSILKYIASGIIGKDAYTGGTGVLIAGLLMHFIIATTFSALFFLLYQRLKKHFRNSIIIAILYGVFIWFVMNIIIIPLSAIKPAGFDAINALINVLILIVCFGFPLVYLARKKNFTAG